VNLSLTKTLNQCLTMILNQCLTMTMNQCLTMTLSQRLNLTMTKRKRNITENSTGARQSSRSSSYQSENLKKSVVGL
jgi:hypothetical protein